MVFSILFKYLNACCELVRGAVATASTSNTKDLCFGEIVLVIYLWERTYDLEVVGSNPGTRIKFS